MNLTKYFRFIFLIAFFMAGYANSNGASTETIEIINRTISYDPNRDINKDQIDHLKKFVLFTIDKDTNNLVRYGKECHADKDPRLNLCLSWCLYILDPNKYAQQFVKDFPLDNAGNAIIYREFEWSAEIPGLTPDPYTCLGQIAVRRNQEAIAKLISIPRGEGGENTGIINKCIALTVRLHPKETVRAAANLFDHGRTIILFWASVDGGISQEDINFVKYSVRRLIPKSTPTEKGIIEDILDFYIDKPGYTQPPFKRPLSKPEQNHLAKMLQYADARNEAGLEQYWKQMDQSSTKNHALALAHQWYQYLIDPKKWRKAFVDNYPTEFEGVSDYYRISHAYRPRGSVGSALKDLGEIAKEGDTQAIGRVVASLSSYGTPPSVEAKEAVAVVLERQPEKTIHAIAAAGDGHAWIDQLALPTYKTLGAQRFIALRQALQNLQPHATKKENRIIGGFIKFSTKN